MCVRRPSNSDCIIDVDILCPEQCSATPGTYCVGSQALACEAGYYCTGDGSRTACPINTYSTYTDAVNSFVCSPCASNEVTDGAASTSCHVCSAGTYLSTALGAGQQQCLGCTPGSSSIADSTTCSACAAGSYSSISGSGTCSPCRPGTYSTGTGALTCTACPNGTYTFTVDVNGVYTATWGSTSAAQCVAQPSAPSALVCLAGSYMRPGGCSLCPIGYYCPEMSTSASNTHMQMCPNGFRSEDVGAMSVGDCSVHGPAAVYSLTQCEISPASLRTSEFNALSITAVARPKASDKSVFFATATAVYRLMLTTMQVQLVAGNQATAGEAEGLYTDARFRSITALAVDQDHDEATVVVIGDSVTNRVLLLDLYSSHVTKLGQNNDVMGAKGIALRKDSVTGARLAYVSDQTTNRIMAFDLDTRNSMIIAGSSTGASGYADGYYTQSLFSMPNGIAFLEADFSSNRILLIADKGNKAIRALDTVDRSVSTWFAPRVGELQVPTTIEVARSSSGSVLVYVADSGKLFAISHPFASDHSIRTLTELQTTGTSVSYVVPPPLIYDSTNGAGHKELLIISDSKFKSFIEQSEVSAHTDAATGVCALECYDGSCSASAGSLCGNFYLDNGEECDDGGRATGGCLADCTIDHSVAADGTSWACPRDDPRCVSPCVAYLHAPTNTWHCANECATTVTPTTGYTIDAQCVEHDIDECTAGTASCSVYAYCTNTPGTHTCTCMSGYYGDGAVCDTTSYAVYTVIELPSVSRAAFVSGHIVSDALKLAFANAVASTLGSANAVVDPFSKTTLELARMFTAVILDSTSLSVARMEIRSHFADLATATAAAGSITTTALATALSAAVSSDPSAVKVTQALKTKLTEANSFDGATQIDGWGMSITSINFNRSCTAQGKKPSNGCWQVELVYVGGAAHIEGDALENINATARQSLNVLYVPHIENAEVTLKPIYPFQTLTMQTANAFPCDTSSSSTGGDLQAAATACCLRSFVSSYRPPSTFSDFVGSAQFDTEVPTSVCNGQINESSPSSSVVFDVPHADGETNDIVSGPLFGMPNSEVRVLETIDLTIRKFRVLVVLAQDDLLSSASLVDGSANIQYTSTFFVGLANFFGTGSSVMQTRNMQQQVVVSKSNTLTLSSYGANQDPLVSYASMQLFSVKVTDFFAAPQRLYYLQPMFTLPAQFAALPDRSIVPIGGIMLSKTVGEQTTMTWLQACASQDGTSHVYADSALQQLVAKAQKQTCVQQNMAMCMPPINPKSLIQFGVPLPIDFISESDFTDSRGVTLRLQFLIVAQNPLTNEQIQTTISLSLQLTAAGYTTVCDTLQQSQTLEDIVSGDVFIGVANSNTEWDLNVLKKTNFDKAGSVPADSFQFSTTTVQGSIMTFAALGDDAYFTDDRALQQGLNIYDMHTVHFLEPLGGKGGASPNFDSVVNMFQAGTAFGMSSDAAKEIAWLTPSAQLLNMCPRTPTYGKMACITRTDSTIASGSLVRSSTFLELKTSADSTAALQGLIADAMFNGNANVETRSMGSNFYQVLQNKLTFNDRYRKAYVLNPILKWSYAAMQKQYPGATPYTICTKIVAIGLISFKTATGTQFRRLLSTIDTAPAVNLWALQASAATALSQRHLLSSTATSLAAATQAVGVDTSKDAVSALCATFGIPFSNCGVITLNKMAAVAVSQDVCKASNPCEILQTQLSALYQASIGVKDAIILQCDVSGCPNTQQQAARRLLQADTTPVIASISQILVQSINGSVVIDIQKLTGLTYYLNASYSGTLLGGGAFISFAPIGGGSLPVDVVFEGGTIGFRTTSTVGGTPLPIIVNPPHGTDKPIINILVPATDAIGLIDYGNRRTSAAPRTAVLALNLAAVAAFAAVILGVVSH